MLLRAFVITLTLLISCPTAAAADAEPATKSAAGWAPVAATPDDTIPTEDTTYEYFPEKRPISDCLSSLPKPNCGSEARGGWRQTAVLGAILAGLGFIGWRIVRQSRKARAHQ